MSKIKNILLAILSGTLLAFSWPTDGFAILLFVAFIPLLIAIDNIYKSENKKGGLKVFALSYLSFVIWNFYTTWWLHYADFGAGLFAVLANSFLMASVVRIYYFARKKVGDHMSYMFLPAIWITFEKLHLTWDLSWPWLNLGNGFAESYKWIQWYEYTGAFGGTLWVWIVNLTLLTGVLNYIYTKEIRTFIPAFIRSVILVAVPMSFSYYTYNNYVEQGKDTKVVVLQPNLDPYGEKFNMGDSKLSKQLVELAENEIDDSTSFVFGPETSLPGGMEVKDISKYPAVGYIKNFLNDHPNTSFVTGATLVKRYYTKEDATETSNAVRGGKMWYDISNSAILVDNTDTVEIYNKSKLVVGVENMPFRDVLKPLLGDFIINLGGTVGTHVTQKNRDVFTNKKFNISAAPIVCYESVYGEFVTGYVRNGANFLSVIANDGWWQNTQGHKQHLSFSRMRAIENRRCVARSANTGTSAFINQRGDIIKSLEYDKKGSISSVIKSSDSEFTIYTQFGDYIARVAMFIAAVIMLYAISVRKGSLTH